MTAVLGWRIRAEGLERIDDADPAVLVANHQSNLDIATYGLVFPPSTVAVGKKELRKIPVFGWYFERIYVKVRPERVFVWTDGDPTKAPMLHDARQEEVRSGHSEEPARFHAAPAGGATAWDSRLDELGTLFRTAVLSIVSPDGFPFAIRVPVAVDARARVIRVEAEPDAMPLQPGLACLTAHRHGADFTWQQNFQVRGDLQLGDDGWVLVPHKLVGGFELPRSKVAVVRDNIVKVRRFHRTAKRELASRS